VLTNEGEQGAKYTLQSNGMQFHPGEAVVEVLGCGALVATQDGEVDVAMDGGRPSVLVPREALGGSGICGT
jgi:hypothetical protein